MRSANHVGHPKAKTWIMFETMRPYDSWPFVFLFSDDATRPVCCAVHCPVSHQTAHRQYQEPIFWTLFPLLARPTEGRFGKEAKK